ncbi:hypothetical protein HOLleu_11374 [Holothuria leucospilota]|uniref:Uncharacterized protein n=1 Tax=Holothuria leucospilota TaxID=206669 RepID=A0A9Q1CF57_HOLLE|nr:hypothetical protein HOLleu_11374 [Holothuria leucospilota]
MAFRYCAYLSEFKIATVCWLDEIGIFDIRDYSYIKKNISHVISSWPVDRNVLCVATDSISNHILVGRSASRDVYVFDDQLNYHHTLTLPEMIYSTRDIAFCEGKLLVCDIVGKKAYVVTMEGHVENKGQVGKVTHELTGPDCDRDDWGPLSVCTDRNGLIYILWITGDSPAAGRKVIIQYTEDGKQLQTQNQISVTDARCMVTVNTSMAEKLLVASWKSGKLHMNVI